MRTPILTWLLLAGLVGLAPAHPSKHFPPFARNNPIQAIEHPVMKVVMVHGFLETRGNYRMLRKRLHSRQVSCLIVRLKPSDGRGGLENLAQQLKRQIDEAYGPDERISLVGFSMGGLVSRYYLQELGGANRCQQLITVSSPHHGTHAARLYPSKGARQMRPGSQFLKVLQQSEHKLGEMQVSSYRTPYDLVILPSQSSIWERAQNHSFGVLLHPWMLNSGSVLDDIEARLLGETKPQP